MSSTLYALRNQRLTILALLIVAGSFASVKGWGQTLYWRTDGVSGSWTGSNWGTSASGPFTTAWTANANAIFTAASTVTFASTSIGNVTVATGITVTVAATTTILSTNGAVRTFDIGAGGLLTWQAQNVAAGSSTGFIKNGGGTWDMGGNANAYTGGFTLNAGTIIVSTNNNGVGGSTSLLTLNGGTFQSSGTRAYPNPIVVGGDFTLSGTGGTTYSGNVALGSSTRIITNSTASGSRTFSGVISGSANLIFTGSGSGTINITGNSNTYTGTTTINGSEVEFDGGDLSFGAVPSSATAGSITIDGGRLTCNGSSSFTINANRGIQLGATTGTSISVKGSTTTLTYNGIVADKPGSTGVLVKQGANTLVLGGISTYTGTTTINNGTLQLSGGSNRLPTATTVSLGQTSSSNLGTFDLNGNNQQIAGLATVTGTATSGNNTVTSASAATLTISGSSSNIFGSTATTNPGIISGALSIVKVGTGTQTFGGAGTYTYTGTTTINGGTLALGNAGILPATTNVTLGGGTFSTGVPVGYTQTAGMMALTASTSSVIALGSGTHTLTFGDSHSTIWGPSATLSITGWTGTSGFSGTGGKLFFGNSSSGLTTAQLAQISFAGYAGGAQILSTGEVVPAGDVINIADNGTQITDGDLLSGSTNNIISTFAITGSSISSYTLNQVTKSFTGTYQSADIAGFKLYESTTNSFSSAVQLGSTQTSTASGSGETVTFGSLSQAVSINTVYYYWITADISSLATANRALKPSVATASNFTFSGSPTVSGGISASGTQTILIRATAATPGYLSVLKIGDGSTPLSSSAFPLKMLQYDLSTPSQTGSLLASLPRTPTSGTTNKAVTQSGTATSEGALNLSNNAKYITLVGYNALPGTVTVSSGTDDPVVARLDAALQVNSVTSFNRTNAYTGNNIRSAITNDGTGYWVSGATNTAVTNGGINYITDGIVSGTGNQLSLVSSRILSIFNNQLYISSQNAPNDGVSTVGNGLPTSGTQTVTLLNTVNLTSGYSFVFLNSNPNLSSPDLLYVAGNSSTTATDNGIYKYHYTGSSWVSEGQALNTSGVSGITGTVDASGKIILYATVASTYNVKPTQLIKYFDNSLPSAAINLSTGVILANSGTNYAFGGVSFTPLNNGDITVSTTGQTIPAGIYRNITIANGGSATLTGNVQLLGSAIVQGGGTLDCGTYTISSYSSDFRTYFSVQSSGTLLTANPAGIVATGNTGSVQTSVFTNATTGLVCSRDFSSGANYIYTGTVAQSTGNALPAVLTGNLTINNAAATNNTTLTNSTQTINGTLTLTSGRLFLPASGSLTLGGAVTHSNGSLTVNATSDILLNGSTNKALYFTSGANTIHNLTIGSTATAVALDNALDITPGNSPGTVTCNGALQTNGYLTLKSDINGTAAVGQSAGTISGNVTVERYTDASNNAGSGKRAWRLMTSPVTGQTIHQAWQENEYAVAPNVTTNTSYGTIITGANMPDAATAATFGYDFITASSTSSIRQYDAVNNVYLSIPSTLVSLQTEQAYLIFIRGDRSKFGGTDVSTANLRATGTLQQGARTAVTLSTGSRTLIGNPYASTIDFKSIYSHNSNSILDQFYLWNSKLGAYGAYVLVNTNGSGIYQATPDPFTNTPTVNDSYRYIPSGSGFFVVPKQPNPSPNSVTIIEADKAGVSAPAANPFRIVSGPANLRQLLVNLNLKDSDTIASLADGFRVQFSDDYIGNEKDNSVIKAENLYENLGLTDGGDSLIIESRGDVKKTDTLQMVLWNVRPRAYQIQVKAENFATAPGIRAWLEDTYLKAKQELTLDGDITTTDFNVTPDSASSNINRFRIVFENASALPVTITKISAQPKNTGAEVSWTVNNEANIRMYTIEKSVDGGRTFTGIGTQAARNSPQAALTTYTAFDAQPKTGENFYRIRIEAKDGSVSYSDIVKVSIGAGSSGVQITLYPNPVRDGRVNLLLENLKPGNYLIDVYATDGRMVDQKKVNIATMNTIQKESLLMSQPAQGNYRITIADAKGTIVGEKSFISTK